MRKHVTVESPRDRVALAEDAGFGRASLGSVVAGTLVAYGAFMVLLAIAGGIAAAVGVNTDLGSRDLHSLGIGGGIAVAVVLFVSYLFGGYVAGRMARRSGILNGLLVFVFGLIVAAAVGGAVAGLGGTDNVVNGVRNVGLPTSASQWRGIGMFAGLVSLAAMLLGSLLGGRMGERWHSKLLVRALDPAIGPESRIRRDADEGVGRADERHTATVDRVRMARAERDMGRDGNHDAVRSDGAVVGSRAMENDRYTEAQREEADRVAAEQADTTDTTDTATADDERVTSRGRHFLRRS